MLFEVLMAYGSYLHSLLVVTTQILKSILGIFSDNLFPFHLQKNLNFQLYYCGAATI